MKISFNVDPEFKLELSNLAEFVMAKEIIKYHASQLNRRMVRKASFRGHYRRAKGEWKFVKPTGATKRSIRLKIAADGLSAHVAPGTHYSAYLEHGTRFMEAQPFVKPALNETAPEFIADLRRMKKGAK